MTFEHTLRATPRTTIIMRDGADLCGPRLITDDAVILGVRAFPFADIAAVAVSGGLAVAGSYLLAGTDDVGDAVYVGESGNLARRLQEHAADPGKAFATDVYVVCGFERRLDKDDAVHLQMRLGQLIEAAGAARLVNRASPSAADLPPWRIASLDRMLADVLPLLFDAGCRCLVRARPQSVPIQAAASGDRATAAPTAPANDDAEDGDEAGVMLIGVTTVPMGVEEQELAYAGLWARGYEHQDRFVVAAGSEMRAVSNASAIPPTVVRRQRLIDTQAAVPIAGTPDRLRLQVAVAFPSRAIAAKVLSGAHLGSDKWRPLRAAAPFIIAA
jgi:predicted GIY-YIG superfamily endonuclease